MFESDYSCCIQQLGYTTCFKDKYFQITIFYCGQPFLENNLKILSCLIP